MMFSIRNTRKVILLAVGALTLCGCVSAHRHESAPVAGVDPIAPDEAMQARNWPQVVAAYPNGSVAAGPTDFRYEPQRGMPEWRYAFADTGTFFLNMLTLPYNLYEHPQSSEKIAKGETVGPTYTAMPILPPPLVYQPTTPAVLEPGGTEPTTPPVVEPPTMPATDVAPPTLTPPTNEVTPPATDVAPPTIVPSAVTPPTNEVAPPAAPVETIPSIAPQPETPPAPAAPPATDAIPAVTTPTIAPPVPEPIAPAPATPAAPPAPSDVNISPGIPPTTPTVIEPPPAEATRNLAPAIHPAQDNPPTTQSDLNK